MGQEAVRERGVIGWVVLIALAIVIALIFGLCKLVIPGDGEDNGWKPLPSFSQASLSGTCTGV